MFFQNIERKERNKPTYTHKQKYTHTINEIDVYLTFLNLASVQFVLDAGTGF